MTPVTYLNDDKDDRINELYSVLKITKCKSTKGVYTVDEWLSPNNTESPQTRREI
jgi:hypothetical protein